MGSFSSKELVDDIIKGGGRMTTDQEDAPDNPRAIRIVEYQSPEGATNWGVVFENELNDPYRYEFETEYIRNPKLIWTLDKGRLSG